MKLSIIVAVAENGVIGRGKDLPWHLSADLKRFKDLTMGHHLLLGRKTFESIGRPLPGRTMVVISRGRSDLPAGVILADSLDHAVEIAESNSDEEAFVAGGAEIYKLALPQADRVYMTRVRDSFEGDVTFPEFQEADWRLVSREDHEADAVNPIAYSFLVYDRR